MEARDWDDIPEERLNSRITRRAVYTKHITLAQIRLDRGAIVPVHQHSNEQITTVTSGRLLFRIGGQEIIIETGQFFAIPPDVPHLVEALEDSIAIDVFSPPRLDWKTGDDAYLRSE